ncbi:hypothetical protein [Clostridium sp. VAP52]|uniref:hypothetical protein n=1 Tax=Clostridium sp. VAP52 TaxID=2949977 RepID=UPI00207934B4|nr:hypothetical protein [Clostridium sp. VAP52]
MFVKIKDGVGIEIDSIASARTLKNLESIKVVVSYLDPKKTPDIYINCETEDEANKIVDQIIEEVNDSKKVKFYAW